MMIDINTDNFRRDFLIRHPKAAPWPLLSDKPLSMANLVIFTLKIVYFLFLLDRG